MSAAIAFYALLSASPLAIAVVLFAGTFLGEQAVQAEMFSQLRFYIGTDAATHLQELLRRAQHPEGRNLATGLGLLVLLFASSRLFSSIRVALNQIWKVKRSTELHWYQLTTRALKRRVIALVLVGLCALVMMLVMLWKTFVLYFSSWLPSPLNQFNSETSVDLVAAFVLLALMFLLVFKWLPDKSLSWRNVAMGATVTSALFVLGSFGAGLYLQKLALFSAYGGAGTIAMVFLWAYYSAQVFVFGAAFAYHWAEERGEARLEE
ncbi:MAG: YihY/virulence factor BrkB family protein [Myxococcales bacterium]|nr:MAG: YihY/virulence factor BrkB family protein [Myxococcales bacterium]